MPAAPIKRSPQLAPLSRQHHDGLLLGWKLRQGIANGIDAARMTRYVQWFWQQHLVPHFAIEEKYLIEVLPVTHPLMAQMFAEHKIIESLVKQLEEHGDLKKLQELDALLTAHIRFEERTLFAAIEQQATPEQLQLIDAALAQETIIKDDWADAFWLKEA